LAGTADTEENWGRPASRPVFKDLLATAASRIIDTKHLCVVIAFAVTLSACNQATSAQISAPIDSTINLAGCPGGMDAMACDYYKDGIKAGRSDRAAHLSDSYQRHQEKFDSRFEAPFRAGYATGWYNDGK
jgi:hypothetical protein